MLALELQGRARRCELMREPERLHDVKGPIDLSKYRSILVQLETAQGRLDQFMKALLDLFGDESQIVIQARQIQTSMSSLHGAIDAEEANETSNQCWLR